MGRPREFDIDQALNIATNLFWRKGFDNTSISDLRSAMGISAPSFYFAFESKEALFQRITENYRKVQNEIVADALGQKTFKDLLEKLLLGFAEFLTDPAHPSGCLVLNSSIPVRADHPITKRFAEQRRKMRTDLEKRLKQLAQNGGKLPAGSSPATLAQMVVSLVWGMAVEAQSGATRTDLKKMAGAAVSTLTVPTS
ncbi:MAG TPA: TetR/AcrR family transcriptional regulator [Verrucomicrobiae bacterium]|nr:TetR/AcrR family transcriptional regulator [Verrucomicrobiae bacterium]